MQLMGNRPEEQEHQIPLVSCFTMAVTLFLQVRNIVTVVLEEFVDIVCIKMYLNMRLSFAVFVALSACIAVQLGYYPSWMFFQCFCAMTLFYCAHWQTYVSG